MSRYFLMVERDGRGVCVKRASAWTYEHVMLQTVPPLSERVLDTVRAASRWWLVQADNAHHGRVLISEWRARQELGWLSRSPGILATGGAREGTTHPNAGESE